MTHKLSFKFGFIFGTVRLYFKSKSLPLEHNSLEIYLGGWLCFCLKEAEIRLLFGFPIDCEVLFFFFIES